MRGAKESVSPQLLKLLQFPVANTVRKHMVALPLVTEFRLRSARVGRPPVSVDCHVNPSNKK